MVTLSPRFAVLAAICSLATLSRVPAVESMSIDARAYQSRLVRDAPVLPLPLAINKVNDTAHSNAKHPSNSTSSKAGDGGDATEKKKTGEHPSGKDKHAGSSTEDDSDDVAEKRKDDSAAPNRGSKGKNEGSDKDRRWDPLNSFLRLGRLWRDNGSSSLGLRRSSLSTGHSFSQSRSVRDLSDRKRQMVPNRRAPSRVLGRVPHHHEHEHGHIHDHEHDHDHDHDHDHKRDHHDHDHDHDHDHEHDHDRREHTHQHGHDHEHLHQHEHYHGSRNSRSLFIAGDRGESYASHRRRVLVGKPSDDSYREKRDDGSASQGVPGRVDIMSPKDNSTSGQRIASLVLAHANDSASTSNAGTSNNNDSWVLNASQTNQTQIFMVSNPDNSSSPMTSTNDFASLSANETQVLLKILMFHPGSASNSYDCVSFDPNPSPAAPLFLARCSNGSSFASHMSQFFAYNSITGVVRPMWFNGQDGDTDAMGNSTADNASVDPATPQDTSLASVTEVSPDELFDDTADENFNSSSTMGAPSSTASSSGATPSPSSTMGSSGDDASAQTVSLVFVPDAPVDAPTATGSSSPSSSSSSIPVPTAYNDTANADAVETSSDRVMSTTEFVTRSTTAVATTSSGMSSVTSTGSLTTTNSSPSPSTATLSDSSSTTIMLASTSSSTVTGTESMMDVSTPSSASVYSNPPATMSSSSTANALGLEVVAQGVSSSTSGAPTMTPVSTAPYEWKFQSDPSK